MESVFIAGNRLLQQCAKFTARRCATPTVTNVFHRQQPNSPGRQPEFCRMSYFIPQSLLVAHYDALLRTEDFQQGGFGLEL